MTAATLVSVMNGWRAGGMRRVHDFGVSCLIRGASGALAGSQIPKFRTEMQPLVGLGMRRIGFSGHTATEKWRTSESKEERQPTIYQQLRGLREPQSGKVPARGSPVYVAVQTRRVRLPDLEQSASPDWRPELAARRQQPSLFTDDRVPGYYGADGLYTQRRTACRRDVLWKSVVGTAVAATGLRVRTGHTSPKIAGHHAPLKALTAVALF